MNWIIPVLGILLIVGGFALIIRILRNDRKPISPVEARKFDHSEEDDHSFIIGVSPSESTDRKESASKTDLFERSKTGDIIEFSPKPPNPLDPTSIPLDQFSVEGTGVLRGQDIHVNKAEKTAEFTFNDNLFLLINLGKYLLIKFGEGWYCFDEDIVLGNNEANLFNRYGDEFNEKGRIPGLVKFTWRDWELTVNGASYAEYYDQTGSCHIPNETRVKLMLGDRSDGKVFYMENLKTGTDRFWAGIRLGSDLDQNLGLILSQNEGGNTHA